MIFYCKESKNMQTCMYVLLHVPVHKHARTHMHTDTTPSQASLRRSLSWSKLFWAQLFIREQELWLGTFSYDIHDERLASVEYHGLQLCWFIWIGERWLVHDIIDKPSLFRPDNGTGHNMILNSHFTGVADRVPARGSTGTCPAEKAI